MVDSSTMICSQQPLGCKETSSFVIDCSILQHHDDIRMNDLGSWKNSGVHSSYYNVLFSKDNIISLVEKMSGKPSVPRKSVYCLKRSYWKHKQDESFTRQLYELTDWNGKRYHLVYLQYRVKGPDDTPNIKPIPHGNSSRNESGYYRTKQSTKDLMKIKAQHMKPAEAYGELFEEQGGVFDCVSVGDVPRNRKQISNIRYKLSDPKPNKDTLHEVMKLCIEDESRADPFVR